MEIINLIIGPALPYLLGALGLLGAFFGVKRMGANGERRKVAEKRAETAQEARKIDDEVKDHANQPDMRHIEAFIANKSVLAQKIEKATLFLFHSETGLAEAQKARLLEEGVMYCDDKRLRTIFDH